MMKKISVCLKGSRQGLSGKRGLPGGWEISHPDGRGSQVRPAIKILQMVHPQFVPGKFTAEHKH